MSDNRDCRKAKGTFTIGASQHVVTFEYSHVRVIDPRCPTCERKTPCLYCGRADLPGAENKCQIQSVRILSVDPPANLEMVKAALLEHQGFETVFCNVCYHNVSQEEFWSVLKGIRIVPVS